MSESEAKLKVCVIDDDELVRKLLSFTLKSLGCDVAVHENGIGARENILNQKYDIIFIDLVMPEEDGYSCCKSYRNAGALSSEKSQLPIIGLTGGDEECESTCLKAGMTDIIYKPFSKTVIQNILIKYTSYKPDENAPQEIAQPSIPDLQFPCFDKQVALDNLDGNEELLPNMIDMFIQLQSALSDDLDHALTTEDTQLLKITTHTLKTRSLYVGGVLLSKLSKEIEGLCKEGDFGSAATLVPQLKTELTKLKNTLKLGGNKG